MSFSKHFHHSFHPDQSNHSSSDEEITSKDYEKIQTLWKDLRQTRRNPTDSSRPVRKQEKLNLKGTGEYMLSNNSPSLEKQLSMSQDEVIMLRKKLKDAEAEIERCHTKIAKQLNVNAVQANQLEDITTKFENLNLVHKELVEKSKETSQNLLRQLTEREKENEKLKQQMKERVDKLSVVSQNFEHANHKTSQLETAISEKSGEINYLRTKLEETERLVDELQETREYETVALEEVEHLRTEVQRLIRMLKSTKEFKDFGEYLAETDGNKRFLKDAVRHKRTSSSDRTGSATTLGTQRLSVGGAYAEEKELWVPQEAYKVMLEFVKKNRGILTEENMETLLFDLNKIWTNRENAKIERITSQNKYELSKMKRKLSNMSFDEMQNRHIVPRLSTDFKEAQKENHKSSFNISQKLPPSVRVVSGTLRSANRSERTQEDYTMDSRTMKPPARMSTASRRRGDSFEVENDVVNELERLKAKIEEILEEFIIKRKEILAAYNGHPDISLVMRKEDWLLESIESILGHFCRGQNTIKGRKSEKSVNNSMLLNYSMI